MLHGSRPTYNHRNINERWNPPFPMNHEMQEHARDGAPMVLVPAGAFVMGLPETDLLAEDHEKPQRQIHLSAYWVDIYPVTNARYGLFMKANGYEEQAWWCKEGWEWK